MSAEIEMMGTDADAEGRLCQVSRRRFLQAAGLGGAGLVLLTVPGCGTMMAREVPLPRKRLASLVDLEVDKPKMITFPDPKSMCTLVKLGVPAGGGVGPEADIVAFSLACPHMGMTLLGSYNAKHKGLGPCPSHLTRFDLTRYGIMVSGHATESLPQLLLEVENGDVYATGMRGLIYGRARNSG